MLVSLVYLFYGDGTVYKLCNMTIFDGTHTGELQGNEFPIHSCITK
jgi:hypothetical protein